MWVGRVVELLTDYWLIWPLGIVLWLALGVLAFAFFEHRAFSRAAGANEVTLSYFTYTLSRKFPLAIVFVYLALGMVLGGLSVHFFWHWCPDSDVSVGEWWEGEEVSTRTIQILMGKE
jgi:hypothetical protein